MTPNLAISLAPLSNLKASHWSSVSHDYMDLRGDDCTFFAARAEASTKSPGRIGTWLGHEVRMGSDGNEWRRFTRPLVHDDFGFLVELPQ